MPNSNPFTLGIIGAGVMGEAILTRLLASGTYHPTEICVSHPRSDRRQYFLETFGVAVFAENLPVAHSQTVLLGVKPQQWEEVIPDLQLGAVGLVISILAGTSLSTMGSALPGKKIIRAMPNTPCQVGAGITALASSPEVTATDREIARKIFASVGQVAEVPEKWMNTITGLSGSGPGYMAIVIEALTDGGVLMGLPRPLAHSFALQTVLGSALYLQETGIHPAQLKDKVTSPGGTTIAGIQELEKLGLRSALIGAVQAAALRAQALEKNSRTH